MFLIPVLRSMRPAQWTKNLVVFAAVIFAQHLFQSIYLLKTLTAFLLFCGTAGSIYIINDIFDLEQDKLHPINSQRPLASGQLSVTLALISALIILIISILSSFKLSFSFGLIIISYLVLQLLYTLQLKRIVILDIFSIAAGFALRALGGAMAIDVIISNWLLVCTILLSLFLALGKRRAELVLLTNKAGQHRTTLLEYSPELLDQMISVVTSATVVSYILYTLSSETLAKFHTSNLKHTIPFVLYGIFRYLYLIYHSKQGERPEKVLLTDVPLIIDIVCYILVVGVILY